MHGVYGVGVHTTRAQMDRVEPTTYPLPWQGTTLPPSLAPARISKMVHEKTRCTPCTLQRLGAWLVQPAAQKEDNKG